MKNDLLKIMLQNMRMGSRIFWFFLFFACFISCVQAKGSKSANKSCDKTIRTTRLIRSPRVTSHNRGKPVHCVYRLVKYGGQVSELLYELNFKAFHVGTHHNGTWCANGYLQIVDHPSRVNASGFFCGRLQYSRTFLAETSQLSLVFHAETYTRQTYFRAQVSVLPKRLAQERHKELVMNSPGEAIDGTYCDRLYFNCRGFCDVTSPNYPGFYPRNATCRYTILFNETTEDSRVVLGGQYYDSFDVWGGPLARCHSNYCTSKEITTLCPYDSVRIYDVTSDGTILIQTFCGRGHLPRIASKGSQIVLEFVSSVAGSISNDGFYLSIGPETRREQNTGSKTNDSCQWLFEARNLTQGQFHNLRHWYPPGTRCSYRFVGEPHHRVFLHFTYFNANRDEGCRSKLTLYDSNGPDGGALRGIFCGKQQPNETLQSTSERFYVEFDSKLGSYDGSNFEYSVFYTFVDMRTSGTHVSGTLCNETFSSIKGPKQGRFDFFLNRLRLRQRHIICTFRFEGRHTEKIRLSFTRLHFDPTKHCNGQQKQTCATMQESLDSFDRLLLVNDRKQVTDCLCGSVYLPYETVSTKSYLEVQLHLHNIPTLAYRDTETYSFRGRYEFLQVGCGANYLSGKQGQLVFPNLSPKLLPANVHCRWIIEVRHNRHILFKFAYLSLPDNCSVSSLRLYSPWSKDLQRELCQNEQMRMQQLDIEPLGWNEEVTATKTANKVVLELNASSGAHFKLMWTEVALFKETQQPDGINMCEYRCGVSHYCISTDLVCNGVINCPVVNSSWDPLDESINDCASIEMILQWVFITFISSFVVVLFIAASLFWRKKYCTQTD